MQVLTSILILLSLNTVIVSELKTPVLRIKPFQNVTLPLGSSFVVTCDLIQSPNDSSPAADSDASSVEWYDKNEMLIERQHSHSKLIFVDDESERPLVKKLYVTQTRNHHAGRYTCRHVVGGKTVQQLVLTLRLYKDITFSNVLDLVTANVNSSALLPCVVHSQPVAVTSWRRGRTKITSGDKYVMDSRGLTIYDLDLADSGVYHCRAEIRDYGRFNERPITLDVFIPPQFDEELIVLTVNYRQTFDVSCSATGHPVPTFDFFEDGLPLVSDDQIMYNNITGAIHFEKIQRRHGSNITCLAKNVAGVAFAERIIRVFNGPRIYQFQDVLEFQGLSAMLLCISDGHPKPNITFFKVGSSVTFEIGAHEAGRVVVAEVEEAVFSLVINDVTITDNGVYTCRTSNNAGTDQLNATLTIGYAPQFLSNQTNLVFVKSGQTRTLLCSVDCFPVCTTFQWRHEDQLITNNLLFHIHTTINNTTLQVHTGITSYSVYGNYLCTAQNVFGSATRTVELRKADTPVEPQSVTVTGRSSTHLELEVPPPVWNGGREVLGYQIDFDDNTSFFELGQDIVLSGLRPSTMYLIETRAVNELGEGAVIQTVAFTDHLYSPAPVTITSLPASQYPREYNATWSKAQDGGLPILTYQIRYRRVDTGVHALEKWLYLEVPADPEQVEANCTLENLVPSSLYQLEVRAVNALGLSILPKHSSSFVFSTTKDLDDHLTPMEVVSSCHRYCDVRWTVMTSLLILVILTRR